jgi:hypothetical protein
MARGESGFGTAARSLLEAQGFVLNCAGHADGAVKLDA